MKEYKKTVNDRVIEILRTLLESKKVGSLASDLGVKQPKLSEILAERMSAGLDIIQGICLKFMASPDYIILGMGEMFRTSSEKKIMPEAERRGDVVSLASYSEVIRENERLRMENEALKKAASGYAEREGGVSVTTIPVEV